MRNATITSVPLDPKEMESAYREYFEDSRAVEVNRRLTEEMLSASSWLGPGRETKGRRGSRKRSLR